MKRVLSCVLALVLMLTSLSSTAILAIAAGTPTISFNTVEAEAGGEPLSLQLSINNNPGIAGLAVSLKYDTNALTLTETKKGTLFSGFTAAKNFAWDESEDVTADGVLATFTFVVSETAAPGEYDIEVIVRSCANENLDDVDCDVQNGKIIVKVKPVAATGVTLNKESLSLKTGESETLIAAISPDNATNKAVSWKSDDDIIATVDNNGKVTAVKKGTTTITVTTEDGSFTDTCELSVACLHFNQTSVTEKDSDCKNQGWNAYAKCDDCGQLLAENGTTEINEIPFRPLSEQHTGGTATCIARAICTVCGNLYGNLASHNYTATEKNAEALKTEGNCRDKAVYWYSCSACGNVEGDDNHTFLGDKVATIHVGGTALVNQAEANHKIQTDGYTGDTKCLGCNEIISYGQTIPADAHTPANVWSNDSEYHWKECTVVGCGILIDGSKAPHSSDKNENKATCQKQAVCDVCGISYGELASHNYTAEDKRQDALITEGNCHDNAVYYYSCSVCDLVEGNDNHTFLGDKVTAAHVGGTTLINQSEANHKTQTDGYTGDTKCLGCNEIIRHGQSIPAGAHTPASNWTTDGTYHWKVCTVENCGIVIESTKAEHTSTGTNVAACKTQAKCDVCEKAYGSINANNHVGGTTTVNASEPNHNEQLDGYTGDTKCLGCGIITAYGQTIPVGAHAPANVWSNDGEFHWKECTIIGCGIVIDGSKAEHTSAGSNVATCQKAAVCDVCGRTYGTVAAHDYADTYSKDASGHWYACHTSGCTEKDGFAAHTSDHQGGATEEYAVKCTVCSYVIEAQLAHTHVFDQEVATDAYKASNATCTAAATYYKSCKCGESGTTTFSSSDALGHTEGTEWKSDEDNHWHTCTVAGCGVVIDSSKVAHTPDRDAATETDPVKCSVCGYVITPDLGHTHAYGADWKSDKDNHWNECVCGDKANTAAHADANNDGKCDTCGYEIGTTSANPDDTTKPEDINKPSDDVQSPQTGDNSMMWLWIVLLVVSGFGIVATIAMRKKFVR